MVTTNKKKKTKNKKMKKVKNAMNFISLCKSIKKKKKKKKYKTPLARLTNKHREYLHCRRPADQEMRQVTSV